MSYTLKEKFGDLFAEMVAHSKAAAKIDETKVYMMILASLSF